MAEKQESMQDVKQAVQDVGQSVQGVKQAVQSAEQAAQEAKQSAQGISQDVQDFKQSSGVIGSTQSDLVSRTVAKDSMDIGTDERQSATNANDADIMTINKKIPVDQQYSEVRDSQDLKVAEKLLSLSERRWRLTREMSEFSGQQLAFLNAVSHQANANFYASSKMAQSLCHADAHVLNT